MEKIKRAVDRILASAVIFIMTVMVVNVLWQVFTRFILKSPSSFTEELARYLLIWLGLLGASYGVGQKLHLAIDLLPSRLTGKRKVYLELFHDSAVFLFSLFVMIIGGWRLVHLSFLLHQISAALQISIGYVYLAVPLSGALIMFYSICYILENIMKLAASEKTGDTII